jgi:hypothetical protein
VNGIIGSLKFFNESVRAPGTRRRALAFGAAIALAVALLLRNPPRELAGRIRYLRAYASRELAVRRLGGSSAAFDRPFFLFLESARRRLPKGVAGVAISAPGAGEAALYIAAYDLAPIPVALSPARVPAGWVVAAYGRERPAGWKVLAEVPGGALLARQSQPR